ncbi:GmrSD restriction endonuclease domain-containing protein [Pseudoalteromonas gelatinilytica]
MHLTPSDPDIATLYRKIKQGRLDLQPNFQRGEVWGKSKKQRLIDSIIRGWHIPPIHVIQVPNSDKQEVLDGQQRLAAIRDFLEGDFAINGNLDPNEPELNSLDGMFFRELPQKISAKIEDFTIRLLTISDYKPGEPGELFYRLNQPTNLTSAEQRNAYFGEARQQVKDLSEFMTEKGFNRDLLGFSNSRMAYDDVISKFLVTLELGTLRKKITANSVTSRYRDSDGFDMHLIYIVQQTLIKLHMCLSCNKGIDVKLNKATTLSWLIFIHSYSESFDNELYLTEFFSRFETLKKTSFDNIDYGLIPERLSHGLIPERLNKSLVKKIISIYLDRSSSRVADTSSVVLRDMSLWSLFLTYNPNIQKPAKLNALYDSIHHLATLPPSAVSESNFEQISSSLSWGSKL